jgi:hypothetical protein
VWPVTSTATQRDEELQETLRKEFAPAIGTTVKLLATVGSPSTSLPLTSTTTQKLGDGHATLLRKLKPSIITGTGFSKLGPNVTSPPVSSTAVHWLLDGHATLVSRPLLSTG